MAIRGNTSRYDLLCIFFVLLFADLSEEVPIRSHRSTYAPKCQTWDTFSENCEVCSDGYFGDLCELQCRYPNFGKLCQSECLCEEIHCNSTYGCEDDVQSFSSSTLPSTNKTFSVLHLTSNKQVPSTAMVNAGSTPKAVCPKGYFGKTCHKPCRFPSFGDGCQSKCSCNVDNCNHVMGCNVPSTAMENATSTLKTACLKGFSGKTCDMPCRFPSFGDHCQSMCHCNVDNCNHIMGCNDQRHLHEHFE